MSERQHMERVATRLEERGAAGHNCTDLLAALNTEKGASRAKTACS